MGVVSSVAFATRNASKCINQGDYTRGEVAACQAINVVDSVSDVLTKADGAVENLFGKIGQKEALDSMVKSTGAASNIGAVAQKAVNPLLCVAAGARVLKDDDQYAALIEETAAMTTMFGCESLMKYARSSITGTNQATTGMAGKVAGMLDNSDKIKNLSTKVGEWYKNVGASAHGDAKQTLIRVGVDLLFVAGSILAYNAGKKIGELLSHRGEKKNAA